MGHNTNAKGRRKKGGFILLRHDIYDSTNWKELCPKARCIYLELVRRYKGSNNGDISLSHREAALVAHCSKSTAGGKFKQLRECGFIKMRCKGVFSNRHASTWILTSEPYNDHAPTNEWRT